MTTIDTIMALADDYAALLRQCLEALYAVIPDVHDWYGEHEHKAHKAINALKERLK